jgi:hypothetical protein
MRDRVTGEARGFGFVTVEAAAADTVERSEHIIGGRKARVLRTAALAKCALTRSLLFRTCLLSSLSLVSD